MNDSKFLGRNALLARADTVVVRSVDIPALGGSVYVRMMSAAEKDKIESIMLDAREHGRLNQVLVGFRARMAACVICDEEGNLLFDENDLDRLSQLPAAALDKVSSEAKELAAFAGQDVEDIAGN